MIKKISPIIIIFLIIAMIYSFFHISGSEIKNLNDLSADCRVNVMVRGDGGSEVLEYELDGEQITQLKQLLLENSYTRRLSSTIVGVLPKYEYIILADWGDQKTNLYIRILGNEYIQFAEQFGTAFNKIKNPDFEKALVSVLSDK